MGIELTPAMASWLANGERGTSSDMIFETMTGLPTNNAFRCFGGYPSDPDDLSRCRRLLDQVPEFRARLGEMARHGKEWAALVKHWDELCALMDEEAPRWMTHREGRAPKTYELMRQLTDREPGVRLSIGGTNVTIPPKRPTGRSRT